MGQDYTNRLVMLSGHTCGSEQGLVGCHCFANFLYHVTNPRHTSNRRSSNMLDESEPHCTGYHPDRRSLQTFARITEQVSVDYDGDKILILAF